MKKLESGQDQLQRICDLLRHDTLEPALAEARRIESEAQHAAHKLMEEAHKKASERETASRQQIQREQEVFQQNLKQALKQAIDLLRQEIEHSLFRSALKSSLKAPLSNPDVMGQLIQVVIESIRKEGIHAPLLVEVGKVLSPQQIVQALGPAVSKELENGKIQIGSFPAGITVKIVDQDVTLDMSEAAVREWLGRFLRKDFRDMLFG